VLLAWPLVTGCGDRSQTASDGQAFHLRPACITEAPLTTAELAKLGRPLSHCWNTHTHTHLVKLSKDCVQVFIQFSSTRFTFCTVSVLRELSLNVAQLRYFHIYSTFSRSNVTGHHRSPKQKLRAGHRVPSLQRTSCCDAFLSSNVVVCFLCAMHVFDVRASSSSLGCLCATFHFFHGLHYSIAGSVNHPAYLMSRCFTLTACFQDFLFAFWFQPRMPVPECQKLQNLNLTKNWFSCKNVGYIWIALNILKCKHLMSLRFKGLRVQNFTQCSQQAKLYMHRCT